MPKVEQFWRSSPQRTPLRSSLRTPQLRPGIPGAETPDADGCPPEPSGFLVRAVHRMGFLEEMILIESSPSANSAFFTPRSGIQPLYWIFLVSYLVNFLPPSVDSFKWPLVCDVVDQEDALCSSRVGSDDRAEATLAGCVPQLKFHPLSVDQDYSFLESCKWMHFRSKGRGRANCKQRLWGKKLEIETPLTCSTSGGCSVTTSPFCVAIVQPGEDLLLAHIAIPH